MRKSPELWMFLDEFLGSLIFAGKIVEVSFHVEFLGKRNVW